MMKGRNDPDFSIFIRPEITMYAVMADRTAPRAAAPQSTSAASLKASIATRSPAPAIAGVASNIENRAAASRVIPVAIPATIETPEREMPGLRHIDRRIEIPVPNARRTPPPRHPDIGS